MAFWQTFVIIFGSVLAGILLGLAVIFVISRIQKRPMFSLKKQTRVSDQRLVSETINTTVKTKTKSTPARAETLEEIFQNHKKVEPAPAKIEPVPMSKPSPATANQKGRESVSPKVQTSKAQNPSLTEGYLSKSDNKPIMTTNTGATAENKKVELSKAPRSTGTVSKQSITPKPAVSKKVEYEPAVITTPVTPVENKQEELLKKPKEVELPKIQDQYPKSDIYKEFESNLAIANAPWSGKLTSFQTVFWDDDNLKTEPLLQSFQEELTQAYIDIHLANSVVWLSNEVGHRSEQLDESYKQLCRKIAERLNKVFGLS